MSERNGILHNAHCCLLLLLIAGSCKLNNGGCGKNARCVDNGRRLECLCKRGFESDGENCTGQSVYELTLIYRLFLLIQAARPIKQETTGMTQTYKNTERQTV